MRRGSGRGPAADDDNDDTAGATAPAGPGASARPARPVLARDRHWPGRVRTAVGSSCAVLAALVLLDLSVGTLTPPRTACWVAIAVCQVSVLYPPRVTAGEGCWPAAGCSASGWSAPTC
ncbi:hypothetical protein [Streptomyces sp. NPDC018031]|uniref:hypothetical protein n=1 Tax=Streptomyces sp. NPDC018031 TaxID=3365033 RepID=UPI0037B0C870